MIAAVRIFRGSLLLVGLALAAPGAPPFQKKQPATKSSDAFLNGPPFTFEQVLLFIRENVIPPRRQRDAIVNRGLGFSPGPEELARLKAAGASDPMLQLIRDRAKPAPPPKPVVRTPPPPPPSGGLTLTCAPAECEISVGGVAKGTTSGGSLQLSGLRPGPVTVEFRRPGYLDASGQATIEAGSVSGLRATLEPDRQTRESFGAVLFKKVLDSLGGDDAVRHTRSFQAEGSVTLWQGDGRAARWSLSLRVRPDRALVQVRGAAGVLHEVSFLGSQFKTSKGLKGADAQELPVAFGRLRDRQLAAVIGLLSGPKFKMLADQDPDAGGADAVLTAEGSTETITIVLDRDLRPAQVRIGTASGLGSEIVTYSDYLKKGPAFVPMTMQIRPDASPKGIEIRLDHVQIAPKLKDSDYNPRGKPIPPLAR
jgi:hypothetical protein